MPNKKWSGKRADKRTDESLDVGCVKEIAKKVEGQESEWQKQGMNG